MDDTHRADLSLIPGQIERLSREVAALRKALADFCAGHEEAHQALCEQVSHARAAVEGLEKKVLDSLVPRIQPRRGPRMSEEGRRALDRLAAIRRSRASGTLESA